MPKSYFQYKLTGIVIHMGTSDTGHYYSYISDQENQADPTEKKWM